MKNKKKRNNKGLTITVKNTIINIVFFMRHLAQLVEQQTLNLMVGGSTPL